MTPERWRQVDRVFQLALEREGDDQALFLDVACADDGELRRQVDTLLRADARSVALFDELTWTGQFPAVARPEDRLGSRLGDYRLEDVLGVGGMGTVYRASRVDRAFKQQVAVKVLEAFGSGPGALARFEQERQILALLDHRSIARLYDGGTTADGAAYLVMEIVEGLPIDEYCDRHHLGIEDRLRLLIEVARAVESAHTRLVVHSDLKPANILVTESGSPKLIDFGIAKLLDPRSFPGSPVKTVPGLRPLTPEYASPEQLSGDPVTTASDIYSLGIVLFQLLAGGLPFSARERCSPEFVSGEPALPSQMAGEHQGVATARGMTQRQLRRRLSGDIDAIVRKAMTVDQNERYLSAGELIRDLQRHLEYRPISARSIAFSYRLRKFVRRYRFAVQIALVAVVSLVVALVMAVVHADRVSAAHDRAREALDLVGDLFQVYDPYSGIEATEPSDILRHNTKAAVSRLSDQPLAQALLLATIGEIHLNLEQPEDAAPLLEQAYALRLDQLGEGHPDVSATEQLLAGVAYLRGDYKLQVKLLRKVLAERRRRGDPKLGNSAAALAAALNNLGQLDEAEKLFTEALALQIDDFGRNHLEVALTLMDYAKLLQDRGRLGEAEKHLREALAIRRSLLDDQHPEVAVALSNLGVVRESQGDTKEARDLYQQALEIWRGRLAADHPNVLATINNLAGTEQDLGNVAEAESLFREQVKLYRDKFGPSHYKLANALNNLAALLYERGGLDEAEKLHREAMRIRLAAFGEEHRATAVSLGNIAEIDLARGKLAVAENGFSRILEIFEAILGPASPLPSWPLSGLGRIAARRDEPDRARALFARALELRRSRRGLEHPKVASLEGLVGEEFLRLGDRGEATTLLEHSHTVFLGLYGPDHPKTVKAAERLALLPRAEPGSSS